MAVPTPPDEKVPAVQLLITFVPSNGTINVTAGNPQTLADKIFCYGLLELAKDAIRTYKPAPAIETAPGSLLKTLDHFKH